MSLIHNERTKLAATALSNTAVATIVTAIGACCRVLVWLPNCLGQ
jgi:hypothetical protein